MNWGSKIAANRAVSKTANLGSSPSFPANELNTVVRAAQLGSEEAFATLHAALRPRLVSFYFARLRSIPAQFRADLVEEALQNTFVKVWQHLGEFRFEAQLLTWVCTIATNELLALQRRSTAKKRGATLVSLDAVFPDSQHAYAELLAAPSCDTLLGRTLTEAIAKLPPGYKRAVELKDVKGLNYSEITALTGQSLGCAKSQTFKARQALRKMLV